MDVANAFAFSFGAEGDFHKDMQLLKQDLIDPGNRPESGLDQLNDVSVNLVRGRAVLHLDRNGN